MYPHAPNNHPLQTIRDNLNMKNITLIANHTGREVMVNWDNVDFAKESKSVYGDDYVEIHFGKQSVDVKETLEEINNKFTSHE